MGSPSDFNHEVAGLNSARNSVQLMAVRCIIEHSLSFSPFRYDLNNVERE